MTLTAKIKTTMIALLAVGALLFAFAVPTQTAHAQTSPTVNTKGSLNCGADIDLAKDNCSTTQAGSTGLADLIKKVINIFSAVVGSVAVIMIVIGGLRYIISGGDSNSVGGAKNTIIYALVGLVIVAIAQIIVKFVLERTA